MFFKRVECLGFKSFAAKTQVDLQPGISVIVGPNGCGKSNILDAIKWVLGEQSARQMRGKKMQDVIFAGSASFKQLGMAEVTLTIDNSRRLLDMDFDEVQITRRLYRSGESEYLINKVAARRRDIHNLFLGTGVGASAYSILEQGRVDQVINAKPSERRFIFEEAAGVSKYRERKLEALRKLERTDQDLKRLDDMVAEVERQVNALKRQAGKARRFRELTAELRRGEMELLVLRSGGVRAKMKELQTQIAELRDRAQEIAARRAACAADEETAQTEIESVDAKLGRENEDLYAVKTRIADAEHEASRGADRIQNNENRVARIVEESTELQSRAEDLARRRAEHDERLTRANEERARAESLYAERKRDYDALETEVARTKTSIESLSQESVAHRDAISRAENEVRTAEALIARHEDARADVGADIERLTGELAGCESTRSEAGGRLEALKSDLNARRDRLAGLQTRYAETHSKIAALSAELDVARRELNACEARLAALKELRASYEGFLQGVREVMEEADQGRLSGVLGPLVSLLSARPEHEQALEAALGPHLQDVVVEDLAAGRRAAEFLLAASKGRATFWPLDCRWASAPPEQLEAVLGREGVVGHAPALIEREDRFNPIVEALFGDTVLVASLEAAEKLAAEERGLDFVTLDGQIVRSTRAVTGGLAKSAGLLSREREIQELAASVADRSERERDLNDQIRELRARAEELADQIDEEKSDLHGRDVERANLTKDFEAADRRLREATQSLERLAAQAAELEREVEVKRASIEANSLARAEHQARMEEAAARLQTERERARERGDEFIRRGSELAEVHADVEKVRERLVHLEEGRLALDRDADEIEMARAARQEERERLVEEIAEARARIDAIRADLEVHFARRGELEKQLTEDQTERQRLHARLKELAHLLEQATRDERAVENDLHERQLRDAELQTSLGHLNDQAREKFGRELIDIAGELGEIDKDAGELAALVAELRDKIDKLGPVNLAALEEFHDQSKRLEHLTAQRDDLSKAKAQIEDSIRAIDETAKRLFHETFESVRGHFIEMFRRLFNGGKADLIIDGEGDDPLLDGGIEIVAQPPGKKLQTISLMSGGEKAMTAVALLFALYLHKPAPFAVLDEIDAPLDDANVERFKNVVSEFARDTQFIIITHNKQTMALADIIYGVTMEESGVSRLVSVKFEHADRYIQTG
jgi:chromosome segregation protein